MVKKEVVHIMATSLLLARVMLARVTLARETLDRVLVHSTKQSVITLNSIIFPVPGIEILRFPKLTVTDALRNR